jgi:hypothetical protein
VGLWLRSAAGWQLRGGLVAGVGWLRDGAVHGCGAGLLRSELVAFSVAAVQVWLIASLAGCGLCGEAGRRDGYRMGPHLP